MEFERAYYDVAAHRFNHYTTRTPQRNKKQTVKTTYNDRKLLINNDIISEYLVTERNKFNTF